MKALTAVLTALLGALFMGASADATAEVAEDEKKAVNAPPPHARRHRMHEWRSLTMLPDDSALPALAAIRAAGIGEAWPFLRLKRQPFDLTLVGYTEGKRATIEVRHGALHFAVKAYATPPELEARLYEALGGGSGGVHVPRLLGWDRELRVLAIEWLEGPTLSQGIREGQGRRAGELAAKWLGCAAALPARFGCRLGAAGLLSKAYKWSASLAAADRGLGATASAVASRLAARPPGEGVPRLVHGSLYERHVLDMGDGPGLIDWDCFGQGPAELDAAVFLSGVWRTGLRPARQRPSAETIAAFLECTRGLLDEGALVWHRAVTLLRLAHKKIRWVQDDARTAARTAARPLLAEASRLAAALG